MGALATWRDISLIWLIFLTLLTVLPVTILFYYIIKGLNRLRQLVKIYMPIAQEKARFVAEKTDEIGQKISDPVIGAHAKAAQIDGVTRAIFGRRKVG
jgi:hypothetical protein